MFAAWLRQILTTELADSLRRFRRDKRDVAREQSLAADIDQSAAGLEHWLAANHTSPSQAAVRNEELQHLTEALVQLPDDQLRVMSLLKNKRLSQCGRTHKARHAER